MLSNFELHMKSRVKTFLPSSVEVSLTLARRMRCVPNGCDASAAKYGFHLTQILCPALGLWLPLESYDDELLPPASPPWLLDIRCGK